MSDFNLSLGSGTFLEQRRLNFFNFFSRRNDECLSSFSDRRRWVIAPDSGASYHYNSKQVRESVASLPVTKNPVLNELVCGSEELLNLIARDYELHAGFCYRDPVISGTIKPNDLRGTPILSSDFNEAVKLAKDPSGFLKNPILAVRYNSVADDLNKFCQSNKIDFVDELENMGPHWDMIKRIGFSRSAILLNQFRRGEYSDCVFDSLDSNDAPIKLTVSHSFNRAYSKFKPRQAELRRGVEMNILMNFLIFVGKNKKELTSLNKNGELNHIDLSEFNLKRTLGGLSPEWVLSLSNSLKHNFLKVIASFSLRTPVQIQTKQIEELFADENGTTSGFESSNGIIIFRFLNPVIEVSTNATEEDHLRIQKYIFKVERVEEIEFEKLNDNDYLMARGLIRPVSGHVTSLGIRIKPAQGQGLVMFGSALELFGTISSAGDPVAFTVPVTVKPSMVDRKDLDLLSSLTPLVRKIGSSLTVLDNRESLKSVPEHLKDAVTELREVGLIGRVNMATIASEFIQKAKEQSPAEDEEKNQFSEQERFEFVSYLKQCLSGYSRDVLIICDGEHTKTSICSSYMREKNPSICSKLSPIDQDNLIFCFKKGPNIRTKKTLKVQRKRENQAMDRRNQFRAMIREDNTLELFLKVKLYSEIIQSTFSYPEQDIQMIMTFINSGFNDNVRSRITTTRKFYESLRLSASDKMVFVTPTDIEFDDSVFPHFSPIVSLRGLYVTPMLEKIMAMLPDLVAHCDVVDPVSARILDLAVVPLTASDIERSQELFSDVNFEDLQDYRPDVLGKLDFYSEQLVGEYDLENGTVLATKFEALSKLLKVWKKKDKRIMCELIIIMMLVGRTYFVSEIIEKTIRKPKGEKGLIVLDKCRKVCWVTTCINRASEEYPRMFHDTENFRANSGLLQGDVGFGSSLFFSVFDEDDSILKNEDELARTALENNKPGVLNWADEMDEIEEEVEEVDLSDNEESNYEMNKLRRMLMVLPPECNLDGVYVTVKSLTHFLCAPLSEGCYKLLAEFQSDRSKTRFDADEIWGDEASYLIDSGNDESVIMDDVDLSPMLGNNYVKSVWEYQTWDVEMDFSNVKHSGGLFTGTGFKSLPVSVLLSGFPLCANLYFDQNSNSDIESASLLLRKVSKGKLSEFETARGQKVIASLILMSRVSKTMNERIQAKIRNFRSGNRDSWDTSLIHSSTMLNWLNADS
jgi:hypothetical protein